MVRDSREFLVFVYTYILYNRYNSCKKKHYCYQNFRRRRKHKKKLNNGCRNCYLELKITQTSGTNNCRFLSYSTLVTIVTLVHNLLYKRAVFFALVGYFQSSLCTLFTLD